jgi:hypothetical protein
MQEEIDDLSVSYRESLSNPKSIIQPTKKRDVSFKQFEYIWKNKMQNKVSEAGKFKFEEMNLLLNAYEYWRYENKNKQTFQGIDITEARDASVI